MTALVITIAIAWLVFSLIMIITICANSSRLSRIERAIEFEVACERAREKLKRRHNDIQKKD